ncbi:MAG: 16S rRNA (cytidine(1402)-2'-O)-methyltransferase, partial [Burkholderiales bacterium]|nr:16S rRNA (cytidine(1402)-2'-O)-methyltransferase [Burkholderiales bacterium]
MSTVGAGFCSGGDASLAGADCAADNAAAAAKARPANQRTTVTEEPIVSNADPGPRSGQEFGTDARSRAVAGTLYVVATPLGNLRDVTLRALDVLATADVVAAEDTRTTATLLRHYGIGTPVVSLHAHNEARRAGDVVSRLAQGQSVALVSDAGTPAVSDPGARVVAAVRDAGHLVVPLPGPSAVTAAVSAAGLAASMFLFAGFPPPQAKARSAWLAALAPLPAAIVIYEAPHRVRATVVELLAQFGPARTLTVARELTKVFEAIARMPLADAPSWLAQDPNRERGEFVLVVDAPPASAPAALLDQEAERWLAALCAELPPARAARVVSAMTGVARDVVYGRALTL